MPAVATLRLVWLQQFFQAGDEVCWRTEAEGLPPAREFISSPYDPEARYARKDTTTWVGYKVHLTESCDGDAPHLITHVETTPAPIADGDMTTAIHEGLEAKGLLPGKHLADTGYVDAVLLVESRQRFGVDLVGPTRSDQRWQAGADEGFAASNFHVDWERQRLTCPEGRHSSGWTPAVDGRCNEVVKVKFSARDCGACPSKEKCTKGTRRTVTIRPREQYEALQAGRLREKTAGYKEEYGKRAGVEGTISQGVRACGLRRSRYAGEAKTHLQHLATAAALNVLRIGDWLAEKPREQTRTSAFAKLMTSLATAA
jgi:transposase